MYKLYTLFLPLVFLVSLHLSGQIMPVGSGSYTMQLPPADGAGRNVNPAGTPRLSGAALTKPVATSDWWTGLLTNNDATNGANLYNYPLSLKGGPSGLILSYTFLGGGANDTRQPMSPDQPLILGVSGIAGTYPTVSDYSDWTVTTSWNSAGHNFNATIGMGMPFVYCTKGNSDIASVTVNIGVVSVQNEMILITNSLSGANFAVYAPVGSTWIQSDKTYTSSLAGKNYYSVVMLPTGGEAATVANDFKQYAYVFPSNTSVNWTYDNNSSTVRSDFSVTADVKEGSGTAVLLGLLPHQWAHLGSGSPQPGAYSYNTSRGAMKMLPSNTFTIENKFKGILSTLPNTSKYSPGFDPAALNAKIDLVKGEGLALWTDSYNEGLAMNRLVQVAKIADQIGNTQARDQIINTVKTRLENWFKAEAGENAFLFYYNTMWTTLIGYPAGYSADANLNDHHFHYGYFISAAATVEQFQPGWAANWGPMVNMLVKDAANWDKTDLKFPFLRNFNPYAGHSFAAGLLNTEPHGNNQESSSEAMNFNASLITWGELTGNTAVRDLGIYLYTTEQTGIEEYWFNMNKRNFSSNYSQLMCSRLWSDGYDNGTFWTGDIAAMYGIEMFPLTGASLYLGHNISYVRDLWNDMKTKTGVLAKTSNDNLWYDIYWSYAALADPQSAISLYDDFPGYKPKGGCSDAQTYHWLHSLNGSGPVDASVTANYPIAALFNKNGDKTYVAHNYGASEITVTWSDGFSMAIPARTMKSSKDIPVTVSLTASANQVASNGSVTLSAATNGSGITKVEFYDGTTLIGTSATAPYSVTASSLSAKVHGFSAKVYVGAALQLSNVVTVIVGSRVPYGGAAVSIPSQVIEPGNYDAYEGGIGQNITYFDVNTANEAGTFRTPEYVDANATAGEGNTVSYIESGEWLTYTANISQAGAYDLSIRYTSGIGSGGGPFHIEVDGSTVASNINVGYTDSNWSSWASKAVPGVILPAGQHIIKLAFDNGGFNIGKISFTYKGIATPSLAVSTNSLAVTMMSGSKKMFDVISNISWIAVSDQNWLALNNGTGFGNGTITVTALENGTITPRTANIKVSASGIADQMIKVTQDAGGFSYLVVSNTDVTIGITAGSIQTLYISSNVSWSAASDQPWLSISDSGGTGSKQLTLTAQANSANAERVAVVTISGGGLPAKTVVVTQAAAPKPLTLPIDFETGTFSWSDFNGGVANVIPNPHASGINTSLKVAQIIRNGGATWAGSYLTLDTKIDFTAATTFSMKVYSSRAGIPVLFKLEGDKVPTAEVSAKTTLANSWEILTWNFAGNTSNIFNKLTFMFDFGVVGDGSASSTFLFDDINLINSVAGTLTVSTAILAIGAPANSTKTFDITSNVSWTVASNQPWLTLSDQSGSGNSTVTLTCGVNPAITPRTATVMVAGAGVASKTITITQDGAAAILSCSSSALTVGSQANSTKIVDISSNISWTISSDQGWLTTSLAAGSGNGTITLTATENPTIASRTANLTVSATGVANQIITVTQDGGTTGIIDLPEDQFSIHPNPVSTILYLNSQPTVLNYSIFDMSGKLILNGKLTDYQINVGWLSNGIYTLKIDYKTGFITRKFIKQ